ncbi:DUF4230 domain-containing protein [Acidobacteria bacterium AB60]|nr:DUF4230 domain-containing protein [Acidobacteria bacterium AB60]
MPVTTTPARRGRILPALLLALLAGILAGIAALTLFLHAARAGLWDHLASLVSDRATRIDTAQPTILTEIRRLARLESVSFSMEKMVSGDREGRILPAFLTGDRVLLDVHGEAVAGVDFNQLAPSGVQLSARTVHVHLPPAQIFTVALDESKTRVYQRRTGLLVPVDPTLESEVRAQAVDNLRQSALDAGILNTAQKNACATVTKLLYGLGFSEVTCDQHTPH